MKTSIEKLYFHFSRGAKGSMGSPKAEDICKHNDDSDNENDDDDDDYNQNDDDDFKNLDKEERGNDGEVEKTSRDWGREVASLIISTTKSKSLSMHRR